MDIHPKVQPAGHVVLLLCRVDFLPGRHLADQIREASQEKVIQFECLLGLRPQDLQPSFLPRIVDPIVTEEGCRQVGTVLDLLVTSGIPGLRKKVVLLPSQLTCCSQSSNRQQF